MNIRFPVVFTLLVASVLAVNIGCSGNSTSVGSLQVEIKHDFNGSLNHGEALVISATGFEPREFPILVQVVTAGPGAKALVSQARLTADDQGRIDDVVIAYDVGMYNASGAGRLLPGDYTINLISSAGTVETDITIPPAPTGPVVWGCDIDGNLANAFESGKPVFVSARNLTAGLTYRIWPVVDRRSWNNGDIIKSWQIYGPLVIWPPELTEYIEVTADQNGEIEPTQLLPYATKMFPGVTDQFDIVLDGAPFNVFNTSTDAVDGQEPTGAVVQDPAPDGPIYAELASKMDYTYSNSFKVGDKIAIWLNPGVTLGDFSPYILKYIVLHHPEWLDGTPLEDITEGVELDPVEIGCVNEGLILAWILAQVGEYDVFLDINANGIYDEGIDVVDGGPSGPGFVVTE